VISDNSAPILHHYNTEILQVFCWQQLPHTYCMWNLEMLPGLDGRCWGSKV